MSEYPFKVLKARISYPVVVLDFEREVWDDLKTADLTGWLGSLNQPTIALVKNLPEDSFYYLPEMIFDGDNVFVLAVEIDGGYKIVASCITELPGFEKGQVIGHDSLVRFEG